MLRFIGAALSGAWEIMKAAVLLPFGLLDAMLHALSRAAAGGGDDAADVPTAPVDDAIDAQEAAADRLTPEPTRTQSPSANAAADPYPLATEVQAFAAQTLVDGIAPVKSTWQPELQRWASSLSPVACRTVLTTEPQVLQAHLTSKQSVSWLPTYPLRGVEAALKSEHDDDIFGFEGAGSPGLSASLH